MTTINEQYEDITDNESNDSDYPIQDIEDNESMRFLQLYTEMEHEEFYLIDNISIGSRFLNDKNIQTQLSLIQNLKELSSIMSYTNNLDLPDIHRISSDIRDGDLNFYDCLETHPDLKLYVLCYKNSIKYIVKNIHRLLKLSKVFAIDDEEGYPIIFTKPYENFVNTFGNENRHEPDCFQSIITPFINDRNDRNNITINSNLCYNYFGEEDILNDWNYVSLRDGIETDLNFNEIELRLIRDHYEPEEENDLYIKLVFTRDSYIFHQLMETEHDDRQDISTIEGRISSNIQYFLEEEQAERINIGFLRPLTDEEDELYNNQEEEDELPNTIIQDFTQQRMNELSPHMREMIEQRARTLYNENRETFRPEMTTLTEEEFNRRERIFLEQGIEPFLNNEERTQLNIQEPRRIVRRQQPIRRVDTTPLKVDTTSSIFSDCCCCFNEKELVKLIPCNHKVICYDCIMNLYHNHNKRVCPVCRKDY